MSNKNPKVGRGPCPNCGASIAFRRSPTTGKLTYTCDTCDHAGFADLGGAAHAKWMAVIKLDPGLSESSTSTPPTKPASKRPAKTDEAAAEAAPAASAVPAAPAAVVKGKAAAPVAFRLDAL